MLARQKSARRVPKKGKRGQVFSLLGLRVQNRAWSKVRTKCEVRLPGAGLPKDAVKSLFWTGRENLIQISKMVSFLGMMITLVFRGRGVSSAKGNNGREGVQNVGGIVSVDYNESHLSRQN
jgi:hypothetical protein